MACAAPRPSVATNAAAAIKLFMGVLSCGCTPNAVDLRIRSRRLCDAQKHGAEKFFKRNGEMNSFMLAAQAELQICRSDCACARVARRVILSPRKRGEDKSAQALVF